jgi:hypothetical protein
MKYLDRPMVFVGEENTDIRHEKKHVKLTNSQSKNDVDSMIRHALRKQ